VASDFYQVLGVSRDATADDIQQAYRRMARRYHPDINHEPGAEDRFKDVNEAYQVLSDPGTRRRYDRFGENFRQVPEDYDERVGAAAGGGFRGGGGGPRAQYRRRDVGGFDSSDLFEDLFGDFFGARGAAGPIPGADQEAELELTVEEAYRGGRRRITLDGAGQQRSYEVTVPPGVVDGQRIRLAGQGGRSRGDARHGDLYLVVRIAPHPRYRLSGRDINVDLPVTPWEAALGATIPVSTPGGEVKIKVPKGSSSGRRLRVAGEGMPNRRGKPGDLYAEVTVHVPSRLSRRERELFEELANVSAFDPRSGS
jgi:curved DNA-binding protein